MKCTKLQNIAVRGCDDITRACDGELTLAFVSLVSGPGFSRAKTAPIWRRSSPFRGDSIRTPR